MAQNPPANLDLLDDQPTAALKASLNNLEDPLDPQLLENLSLFFKVKGANPVPLIKLYTECITTIGKDWEPFIATLGSTLNEGVIACEYIMVKYFESSKVLGAKDFSTMLSDISNFHNTVKDSAAVANASASTTLSSKLPPASLNQFIWEDGKSYMSKVGIVTANRDKTIAFNVSSLEYLDINILRNITMNPKNWEFILNRDLIQLYSYLSLNQDKFANFNNKDITKKGEILKDLAAHVPVNMNQWSKTPVITESLKIMFPCKFELEYELRIDGEIDISNLKELIEAICFINISNVKIQPKPSEAAKQFIWHFISENVDSHFRMKCIQCPGTRDQYMPRIIVDIFDKNTLKGLSEGSLEENEISTQSDSGERIWELTDHYAKYVKVLFSYKLQYSTYELSEKQSLRNSGYKTMAPPSVFNRAKLLELQTQPLKTHANQSEFMTQLLYKKCDAELIPID